MSITDKYFDNMDSLKDRDPSYMENDKAFVQTLGQAAMNVELFTIPLYMTAMYSIVGVHQINTGNDFYKGRWWPGSGPSATPNVATKIGGITNTVSNQKAFNAIFSVFMEEMLHLQSAANITSKLGGKPSFTSNELQDDNNGWTCYGSADTPSTTIPHIINLTDCKEPYSNTKVTLGPLNQNQIDLFIAIEESEETAWSRLKPENIAKYDHVAPYDDWKAGDNLPMFGTIGRMYRALWDYIEITYSDGTSLLGEILKSSPELAQQRDKFNEESASHPMREFPGIDMLIYEKEIPNIKTNLINIINSITDQGEGANVVCDIIKKWDKNNLLSNAIQNKKAGANAHMGHHMKSTNSSSGGCPFHKGANTNSVDKQFQPNPTALKEDYVGYNDSGDKIDVSGQAKARIDDAPYDHFETFSMVKKLMNNDDFMTWDMWHKAGNKWSADMLQDSSAKENKHPIPPADMVANALNTIKANKDEYYETVSLSAVGTIKGLTTTLNTYWNDSAGQFPGPAMGGSGDRVSICWAIFGEMANLREGIKGNLDSNVLYNACQGMSMMPDDIGKDTMPDVRIYHSCKGSNECKTQGGCGYVHNAGKSGGQCGSVTDTGPYSAPANNKCGALGGCAVPISASQMFPTDGKMQLHTYSDAPEFKTEDLEEIGYNKGDFVYDIAWNAYIEALKAKDPDKALPPKPLANPLRLAFPPST
jgi:hypothetical protein